jgi:hypothetical protein
MAPVLCALVSISLWRTPDAGFGSKFNTSQCTTGWGASASAKVECKYDAGGITANHNVSFS